MMSLCIGWIRKVKDSEEIVLISDSCFSGGHRFMAAPKLFTVKRGDFALACAGSTTYSFAVIEHIRQAMDCNELINHRTYDLADMIHYVVDITNETLCHEKEKILYDETDFKMILGGYSWKFKRPMLRIIEYSPQDKRFFAHDVQSLKLSPIAIIGDTDAVAKAYPAIYRRLDEDGVEDGGNWDMQPLSVLLDYIKDPAYTTIGGAPQMVKVYPYLHSEPWGITDGVENRVYFYGRKLLKYEVFSHLIYNINTGKVSVMKVVDEKFKREYEKVPELKVEEKK